VVNAGAAERVTLTADDVTWVAVEDIAALLRAEGFAVERRVFVRVAAEGPRRVVLPVLERPITALVALVSPPAALLGPALVAALYPAPAAPVDATTLAALATLQLKAEGAFASISARTGLELLDALRVLAGRVQRAAWVVRPVGERERCIAYVDGTWYSE